MNPALCEALPFGRTLAILTKSYFGALAMRLDHLEIERYYSILIVIEDSAKPCSQQYICDLLKMDKVSMVRIIDYLIKKEYVNKVVNPKDRRVNLVELTKKAKRILPEIHKAIERVNNAALNGISEDKQKELNRHLAQIQSNLESQPTQKIVINYKKSTKRI